MHIDFNDSWPPHSWMYNVHNDIQFETIPTSKIEKGDIKHSDYLSIYIAVLLAGQVFDCDVTGVPCEWYMSMKLKTAFSDFFHSLFHTVFLTIAL